MQSSRRAMLNRREMMLLLGGAVLVGCSTDEASGTAKDSAAGSVDGAATDAADAGDAGSDLGADTSVATDSAAEVAAADPSSLVVFNYNVMCSFCKNSDFPQWEQAWKTRVPWLADVVQRYDPDLIGLQELNHLGIAEGSPDEATQILGATHWGIYYYLSKPGDAFDFHYPDACLAWRKSRFELLETGQFWLSPEPDVAYSVGFSKGMQFPRLVVWARLKDKASGREIAFANTHFDNNAPSQELSAPLSLQRLAPLAAKSPLIFCGDFNSAPGSKAYGLLVSGAPKLVDTYGIAKEKTQESNVKPTPAWDEPSRIDHVFVTAPLQVDKWSIDLWRYGQQQQAPSDHPGAVVVKLRWPL